MSSQRVGYTINPETGKQIKIDGPTCKRLASKYYMIGDTFTDQTIPDSRAYLSNKIFGMKQVTPKRRVTQRRVSDPKGERKYLIVGSKIWNERFLEYEWNGHEFCDKRGRPLPEFMNTVEKRREARRNKAFARFGSVRSQSGRRALVGRDRLVTWICAHVLSHRARRYVQGVGEGEAHQEGLPSQQRF